MRPEEMAGQGGGRMRGASRVTGDFQEKRLGARAGSAADAASLGEEKGEGGRWMETAGKDEIRLTRKATPTCDGESPPLDSQRRSYSQIWTRLQSPWGERELSRNESAMMQNYEKKTNSARRRREEGGRGAPCMQSSLREFLLCQQKRQGRREKSAPGRIGHCRREGEMSECGQFGPRAETSDARLGAVVCRLGGQREISLCC